MTTTTGARGTRSSSLSSVSVDEASLDGDHHLLLHLAAHLLGDDGGGVEVDHLAQRGHDAVFHQALDHLCAGLLHAAGQLAHGDLIGDLHGDGASFWRSPAGGGASGLLLLAALVAEFPPCGGCPGSGSSACRSASCWPVPAPGFPGARHTARFTLPAFRVSTSIFFSGTGWWGGCPPRPGSEGLAGGAVRLVVPLGGTAFAPLALRPP